MKSYSLNGEWRFKKAGDEDWLPAAVPGCVHTDLLAAGQIPDPYYRDNENQVQWIGEAEWQYTRQFEVGAEFLAQARVLLRCESLDTLASIRINGQEIGKTDNQFRVWEFDVKDMLRAGENEIEIGFDPALLYGQERLKERYIHSWSTDTHKLPGGNYVRKSQCNFGWDWGPKLVTCGIQGDIGLLGFETARLEDVHILQDHQEDKVELAVEVKAETLDDTPLKAQIKVSLGGEEVAIEEIELAAGAGRGTVIVESPKLWWPNGLGEQPLYEVQVTLLDGETVLDTVEKRIGLRELRLVREADEWGESFHFECNEVPFFAKGANWIPADTFINRVSAEDYRRLLEAAKDTHQNMLRIWGGGIYESDLFYELCDEMGITIWQDFMFSCATYPTFDEDFMANAEEEARQQIRRIRHHACLALWCGNNELEQGLVKDEWSDTAMSWADYKPLFDDLLPELVSELDPQTDYWPGSPHSPQGDRQDWNNPKYGDAHIWAVWHGMEPFEFYRTCFHRFNSEFGFQSFPEPRSIRDYTIPADESINSPVMEHHQRSDIGNARIIHYMLDWFRLPVDFDHQIMLSQVLQGMAIKYAVEHWRRTMPQGMGTLYWQLNDCWPVASWASIDYYGRWKALHYMARHFFAPLLVSGLEDAASGTVEIHLTNDHQTSYTGEVVWQLLTAGEGEVIEEGLFAAEIAGLSSACVQTLTFDKQLEAHGAEDLLLSFQFRVAGETVSENLALFCKPKQLDLQDPALKVTVEGQRVKLRAERPALWAWLSLNADAPPSDNFFHLMPGQEKVIDLPPGADAGEVEVFSLWDTYQG